MQCTENNRLASDAAGFFFFSENFEMLFYEIDLAINIQHDQYAFRGPLAYILKSFDGQDNLFAKTF